MIQLERKRSRYAGFCYLCGLHAESHKQYEAIGGRLYYFTDMTQAWVKDVKEYLARQVKP